MVDETYEFDVFLSHNSRDKLAVESLARRLRDEYKLKAWLDIWNLVPGESWQQAIDKALDTCQTFAVFVGPSGIGSWEDPEIQVALDKNTKNRKRRVIPVLLPDAPDTKDLRLPAFLGLLTWVDFRAGLDDKDALFRLYCGIKGITPGDISKSVERDLSTKSHISVIVKNFLPYLADCQAQEHCLQDVIDNETWKSPIVVIVHGDEFQCLDKFLERIKTISLPRLMQLNEERETIKSYLIKWPVNVFNIEDFSNRLLKSLSEAILVPGVRTREDLQQYLAIHSVPVLFHATLPSSEWEKHGVDILDQYIQFWQKWPQLAPGQRLLIFLFINYQNQHDKRILFSKSLNEKITSQLDTHNFSRYTPLKCVVLPRLNGVMRTEAEDWARMDEVRAICDSELVLRAMQSWYSQKAKSSDQDVVSMRKFVDLWKTFLDSQST